MTASDTGISERLPKSAHLIRGFLQMPGRHSLGPPLALDLRAASLCKFAVLQICRWRTPGHSPAYQSSCFPSARDTHRYDPGTGGETARLFLLSKGLMAQVVSVLLQWGGGSCCQSMPWDASRAIRRAFSARNLVSSSDSFGIEPEWLPENRNLPEYPDTNPRNLGFQSQGFVSEAALTSG